MARGKGKGRGDAVVQGLLVLACVAPVLVLVSAMGVRTGLLSAETGYDLLTLQAAWWLSFVGAAAGLLAVVLSLKAFRRQGVVALAALVIGCGTPGGFIWQKARLGSGPGENVSTDLNEVPGFGRLRSDAGGGPAVGIEACPGARPLMKQVAPQVAGWALQEAGFTVLGSGVGRADGEREGFWFGFGHDALIRIRPGRTDIRVSARDDRPHGGEACRLATRVSELLHSSQAS